MTEYSNSAQRLIELLGDDDAKQIRKDNPFRLDRNDKIRDFCRRGVSMGVLAEVSGLSNNSISKICSDIQREKRAVRAKRG